MLNNTILTADIKPTAYYQQLVDNIEHISDYKQLEIILNTLNELDAKQLDIIVEKLNPERLLEKNPLFMAMLCIASGESSTGLGYLYYLAGKWLDGRTIPKKYPNTYSGTYLAECILFTYGVYLDLNKDSRNKDFKFKHYDKSLEYVKVKNNNQDTIQKLYINKIDNIWHIITTNTKIEHSQECIINFRHSQCTHIPDKNDIPCIKINTENQNALIKMLNSAEINVHEYVHMALKNLMRFNANKNVLLQTEPEYELKAYGEILNFDYINVTKQYNSLIKLELITNIDAYTESIFLNIKSPVDSYESPFVE